MKKETVIGIILVLFAGGMIYVHRRVIKAFLTGKPMPKAPAWHFWVNEKARKSS
ncbi:MAG: hypothetical protein K5776_01910 [Lachnospiraceae bacterium]|nr:hypothetical protein [Lachnospiraceae bacterium]